MKKLTALFLTLVLIFSFAACSAKPANVEDADIANFTALRDKVEAAGYTVSDAYVDSNFKEVSKAFSVKVYFDSNTIAAIPIILTKTEEAAIANCEMFGPDSIKLPIRNGKIFSYPGKDYPENVLALVEAIVNNAEIPENTFVQ